MHREILVPHNKRLVTYLCSQVLKVTKLETLSIRFLYSSFKIQKNQGGLLFKQCRHEIYLVTSSLIHAFLFLLLMKLPSRTPETSKMILLSGTIKSAQVSRYKAEMAACKPPMESNFAFL